jgi:hypothetical protein
MWVGCARTISVGHGEDYYSDYHGYVSWRESIDDVIAALPEADALVVRAAVEPADTQFRNHTVDDGGEAMSQVFSNLRTDLWYWRRVPAHGPIARSLGIEEAP